MAGCTVAASLFGFITDAVALCDLTSQHTNITVTIYDAHLRQHEKMGFHVVTLSSLIMAFSQGDSSESGASSPDLHWCCQHLWQPSTNTK